MNSNHRVGNFASYLGIQICIKEGGKLAGQMAVRMGLDGFL